MNMEAGSISGYVKYNDNEGNILNDDYAWNYIAINGSYYLIDILYRMPQHHKKNCFLELLLKFLFIFIFQKKVNGNYYQSQ